MALSEARSEFSLSNLRLLIKYLRKFRIINVAIRSELYPVFAQRYDTSAYTQDIQTIPGRTIKEQDLGVTVNSRQ